MANKNFFIPQVVDEMVNDEGHNDNVAPESKKKYEFEGFVSSIYGKNVKNNTYFHGVKYGNEGRQYDSFRDKEQRKNIDDFKDYIIPKAELENENNEKKYQEEFIETIESKDVDTDDFKTVYPEEVIKKEEFVNVNDRKYQDNYSYQARNEVSQNKDYESLRNTYNYNQDSVEKINVIVDDTKDRKPKTTKKTQYKAPTLNCLKIKPNDQSNDDSSAKNQRNIIDVTLKNFDIGGRVVTFTKGPTVTRFEVELDQGVRLQKVASIQQNLQANLRAINIIMQIPIPGKNTIGIEVPNINREVVYFGDLISNKEFLNDGNPMKVVLGVNIDGDPVYLDLSRMPHGLIGGSTGSGKSVCINAIIASILYKAHPDDVKLILVDPKRVEFARYQGIPHLASPIITDPKMANAALKWAVEEMENRYRLFEAVGVTKYQEYVEEESYNRNLSHIPYIVIIIDELADLMVQCGNEVEESILRITQKARAAGIHLIVATQRPSVDVIRGTVKTNIPTRIGFKVQKAIDSTIILDHVGAEKLLGNGDMLYTDETGFENRIQGAFISTVEIKQMVSSLEEGATGEYLFTEEDLKKKTINDDSNDALNDERFEDVARYVVESQNASINIIQKKFSFGFGRAQAIMVKLGELGVVSENLGSRAREVLVNSAQLEEILRNL